MLASYGRKSFLSPPSLFPSPLEGRRMKEGRRRREKEEAGPTKGTKGKRHFPYLVDRPDWERQRLPQQRVVPPPPAAVQGRDAVRQGREEIFEEARGLPTRKRRGRRRGRGRGRRRRRRRRASGGGIIGRRRCFQKRELGDEPVVGFFVCLWIRVSRLPCGLTLARAESKRGE